ASSSPPRHSVIPSPPAGPARPAPAWLPAGEGRLRVLVAVTSVARSMEDSREVVDCRLDDHLRNVSVGRQLRQEADRGGDVGRLEDVLFPALVDRARAPGADIQELGVHLAGVKDRRADASSPLLPPQADA